MKTLSKIQKLFFSKQLYCNIYIKKLKETKRDIKKDPSNCLEAYNKKAAKPATPAATATLPEAKTAALVDDEVEFEPLETLLETILPPRTTANSLSLVACSD